MEKFALLRPHTQEKLSSWYRLNPLKGMTLDHFDQLSDEDQSDVCELEGNAGVINDNLPINALLALPHETRLLFRCLSQADDGRGGSTNMDYRYHMTDLELIFTMLGENVTTEISKTEKPAGIMENKKVAQRGGAVAGNARKETEKELGKSVK